jgi:transcription antitermination protein NusB
MLPKRKLREIVFQLLYSNDFFKIDGDEYISVMMKMLKTTKKNILAAYEEVKLVEKEVSSIDVIIRKNSKDYRFERISKIELNILRLGFYEILYKKLPLKIAISEALRLCTKFSGKDSAKFINAILDSKLTSLEEETSIKVENS